MRERLLAELYRDAAESVATQLDELVAGHRRPARTAPDETAAWIIAYPDHLHGAGEVPLAALASFVADQLAPWITGVHTLPLHPASSDGGFAVVDPDIVDPVFGDWSDVERLAAGSTWMYDLVVNHMSASSTWFRRFLDGDPAYADFFTRLPAGTDTTTVVRPRTSPLRHEYEGEGGTESIWTTFSRDQVDLDYRNHRVLLAMVAVLLRAIGHGAGAVRLDAVPFLWKDPATTSVHRPETHTIVAILRSVLADAAPGALLVTETNVPQPENLSYVGTAERPEADAVYQFPLPPLAAHAALTGDTEPLRALARSIAPSPSGATFLNVLATHDGIGLRPADGWLTDEQVGALAACAVEAGGVVNLRSTPHGDRPYELAVTWFALMSVGAPQEVALARHMATHALALALPGIPLLYLNSLFAVGNDTATFERTGHGRDLNRARHDRATLDAALADPTSVAARSWTGLRRLLTARRASPAFHPLAAHRVLDAPDGTFAIARWAGEHQAIVAVDLAGCAATVPLPRGRWRDLGGGEHTGHIPLAPSSIAWLTSVPIEG